MKSGIALMVCLLAGGCVTTQEVAPDRSAIAGVVIARGHSEVLDKKARDEQFIPQYDRRHMTPESGIVDYANLQNIFVGLVDSGRKPGKVHEIAFFDEGARRASLALALGETIRIRNAAARPLTFFLAGSDSDAFRDIGRIAPSAMRDVRIDIAGRLELTTDEAPFPVSHLYVRRGLDAVELASGEDFSFSGLVPGEYNLVIWHWRVGTIERSIRLQPGRVYRVDEVLAVDRTVR